MPAANETTARQSKWQASFAKFAAWDTPRQRAIQEAEATVLATWLLDLQLPHYDILEIGCGNGYFGACVIEALVQSGSTVTYHFTDFLPECIEHTKELVASRNSTAQISYSVLDVYQIDSVFAPESQSIILSTGFASAATYQDAVPKVARVLKPDGLLLCDFVNGLSPTIFFKRPLQTLKRLWYVLQPIAQHPTPDTTYHVGIIGLRRFFQIHNLSLVRHQTIRWRRNPLLCMFRKD